MFDDPSSFRQLPDKVVPYTGTVQKCPRCDEPMEGEAVRHGFMTAVVRPHNAQCVHCNWPGPDSRKS